MNLISLPQASEDALRARGLSDEVLVAIRLVTTCLEDACEWVADDCGPDRHDDTTSEGVLRWRRARNYVLKQLRVEAVPELAGLTADVSDNALQLLIGDCRLSFYAARNGVEHPDLTGGSKVKRAVVSEMQLQLAINTTIRSPERLVLLYAADRDGLTSASVGMLDSERSWAWDISVFRRSDEERAQRAKAPAPDLPPYTEQPVPDVPQPEPRKRDAEEEEEEEGVAGPGASK